MAVKIVVATHGEFGKELVKSAGMLVGDMSDVITLSLMPGMSFEDFANLANITLEHISSQKILCFVDMLGGTPSNTMTALTKKYPMKVITGLSLPILVDTFLKVQSGESDVDKLAKGALCVAEEAVVITNEKLKVNE